MWKLYAMAGDVRGPFFDMNIISEKKDQQRNGPALKNQQEEGRDHSDIQHLQTSVDLEVRNHIEKMDNPPAQGVRNCKYCHIREYLFI